MRLCAAMDVLKISEVTFEGLLYKHGLTKEKLQEECCREIVLKIAPELKNWATVGQYLNVPCETLVYTTEDQGKVAMLDAWQKKEGKDASYIKLASALYNSQGNQDVVELLFTECAKMIEHNKMAEEHSRRIVAYWTPERIAGTKSEPVPQYELSRLFEPVGGSMLSSSLQSTARSEIIPPCKLWKLDQWLHIYGYGKGHCTGKNTVIAIIGGGVDISHQIFNAKFRAKQMSGHNFVPDLDPQTGKPILHPMTNTPVINLNEWRAKDAHGTAVAAIAGGHNYGVAPDAFLYICRTHHDGKEYADLIHPLQHILELKQSNKLSTDIVCMSLGSPHRITAVERLLPTLAESGIICVAAAGNEGFYQQGAKFPASDPNVLSVGSLTPLGHESDFNPPTGVDIFAPGENIVCPSLISSTSTELKDGSSFAAPMVAGFLALLIQHVKNFSGSTPSVVNEYHNIRFLKRLLLNQELCYHNKLISVEAFLADLIRRPMDIRDDTPRIISLIKAQDPHFQP